jgi:hypothetical protein
MAGKNTKEALPVLTTSTQESRSSWKKPDPRRPPMAAFIISIPFMVLGASVAVVPLIVAMKSQASERSAGTPESASGIGAYRPG